MDVMEQTVEMAGAATTVTSHSAAQWVMMEPNGVLIRLMIVLKPKIILIYMIFYN